MVRRQLGQSGIDASVVAFGAWAIGGWKWGGSDDDAAIKAIHASIDQGIDFVDTAPIYGFGHSEEVVGKAISDRRSRVVLATKCGLRWEGTDGDYFFSHEMETDSGTKPIDIYKYQNPESIRREVEDSLRRLKTDYIDLYQTHWQDPTTPIEATMEMLMKLKEEGKIRAIGVSNATPDQMKTYQSVAPIDSDQEKFSMLDQEHAAAQRDFVADEGIAFLAYSPLGQGLLTGKIGPEREFSPGDQRIDNSRFSVENRNRVLSMLREFSPVTDKHGITPAQLALAWAFHQRGCSHVLAGARDEKQVTENAAAGEVTLDAEDLSLIDKILAGYLPEIE